jgi:hypothetical protein
VACISINKFRYSKIGEVSCPIRTDINTILIHPDTRIEKVSVKSLFLKKKIISDTRPILPDTRIGKVSGKYLFLNKK